MERETPLKTVNVTKVIFRPIKRLKLTGSWSLERSANFYSVLSGQNSTVAVTIFCIVYFEADARVLELMTFQM